MSARRRTAALVGAVALTVAAIVVVQIVVDPPEPTIDTTLLAPAEPSAPSPSEAASPPPEPAAEPAPPLPVMGAAPDFTGVTAWLNSEPLALADLRGRVVLVDFWTYSCINCIRTLPYVRAWHDAYGPHGLTVVGVHTPEFAFEHDEANVREALTKRGVTWSVAMDNGYRTWRAYQNRYWPHKFLIDQQGRIRYHHIGEGAYAETEQAIRALLAEGGANPADLAMAAPAAADDAASAAGPQALDLFAGRGFAFGAFLGNGVGASGAGARVFEHPAERTPGRFYLDGRWAWTPNAVLARPDGGGPARVLAPFHARTARATLGPSDGQTGRVRVTLDGAPLPADRRGADVQTAPNGETYLLVDEFRLYSLLHGRQASAGELALEFPSDGLALYSLSLA